MERSPFLAYNILSLALIGLFWISASTSLWGSIEQLTLMQKAGQFLKADAVIVDETGWTHFYNKAQQKLILSVYTDGQDIGNLEEGLTVSSGLLANYGRGANDLSGADYVTRAIWLTMNRYWRVDNSKPVRRPVRIRFYFDQQDFKDIRRGIRQTGNKLETIEDLQFYSLEGGSIHPFSTRTKSSKARFSFFAKPSPYLIGEKEDFFYAEFEVSDLSSSGSGGFLIPLNDEAFSIQGSIYSHKGVPIENAYFRSPLEGAMIRSTGDGEYTLANLDGGQKYRIEPEVPGRPLEGVTILDLLAMEEHIAKRQTIEDPYDFLASDLDQSGQVDEGDRYWLQRLILGETAGFSTEKAWQFIPKAFPLDLESIYQKPIPNFISLDNLYNNVANQDFVAVKTGNLWEEADFPNEPPIILAPNFYLENVTSCGKNTLVEVHLRVNDFQGVRGFQFSLEWNPEIMLLDSAYQFNLPNFDANNLGTNMLEQGNLGLLWYIDQDHPKTSLPDGSTLLTLRFKIIQETDEAEINFSDFPTATQVIRKNLSTSNVLFTLGRIKIEEAATVETPKIKVFDVDCFGKENGQIIIEHPEAGNYQYRWNNGSRKATLANLGAGAYQVTITQDGKCPFVSDTVVLEEPNVLFVHNKNIHHPNCPGLPEGAISFKVSGGKKPYQYEWDNGAKTPWVTQLTEGAYQVTITDDNGCMRTEIFDIYDAGEIFINYSITPSAGENTQDGKLAIRDLIGVQGPFSYEWDNGSKEAYRDQLAPGSYQVTITCGNGCAYVKDYKIPQSEPKLNLEVDLERDEVAADDYIYVDIESPISQALQMKIYTMKNELVWQQVVAGQTGLNRQFLLTPTEKGVYMLQVLGQSGSVKTTRFEVF